LFATFILRYPPFLKIQIRFIITLEFFIHNCLTSERYAIAAEITLQLNQFTPLMNDIIRVSPIYTLDFQLYPIWTCLIMCIVLHQQIEVLHQQNWYSNYLICRFCIPISIIKTEPFPTLSPSQQSTIWFSKFPTSPYLLFGWTTILILFHAMTLRFRCNYIWTHQINQWFFTHFARFYFFFTYTNVISYHLRIF